MIRHRVTLVLPMAATGKARPREGGRLPNRYRAWKKKAAWHLTGAIRRSGWRKATDRNRDGVGIRVVAYSVRPASPPAWMAGPERAEERAAWRAGAPVLRLATPDNDNLEGAVWDALNDTGLVWADDSQAISLGCWEWYAAPGEPARIEIELVRIGHNEDPRRVALEGESNG